MPENKEKFNRYEFKYVLDPAKAMMVKDFILGLGLERDKNMPPGGEMVTSLYFDTFGLDDYYDKRGGVLNRKKVRTRIYGRDLKDDLKEINLEIKNKYDMFVLKERKIIPTEEWSSLIEGKYLKTKIPFIKDILIEGRTPTLIVTYIREAYEENFTSRVRITFDREIVAFSGSNPAFSGTLSCDKIPLLENGVVLEVKFEKKLPWWFGFMIKKFNLSRTSFSKYSHGINALYKYNPLPQ